MVNDQIRLEKLKFSSRIGLCSHQLKIPFTLREFYLLLDAREEIPNDVANIAMSPADQLHLLPLFDPVLSSYKALFVGSVAVASQA